MDATALYMSGPRHQDSGALISGVELKALVPITLLGLCAAVAARSQPAGEGASLELSDCRIRVDDGYPGIAARCGTLMRPVNPADPDSALIPLRVALVPALSLEPEPDPLVAIAGGPGQGSIQFYASYAQAFDKVRRKRDILLLDQRGTGESAAMDCEISDELIEGQFSLEQTVAETQSCLAALPYDPRYFTTSIAVQDLEALRVALAIPQLNLYGVSYGTRVAQHFLRRFPDSTRTVILDGVVPPAIALGPVIAIEAQKALDAIFNRCAENGECNQRFPDIRSTFASLRQALITQPLSLELPNPLDGHLQQISFGASELAGAVRMLSYHPSTVALIPLLVHEAANGNPAPLASQFLMMAESMEDALSLGMHNAVVCTEDVPYVDGTAISRDALEQTYIGPMQADALHAICSAWPRGVIDDDFKLALVSDKPVLLLSGEADPITPPHYAEQVAATLGNVKHLTGLRQGHGQVMRGCMPDIIGRFVDSARINDLEEDCFNRVFAMPFFLDFSGPSP
jgi:pimeloyl-ACP methyl ester carboxylesterase